MPKPGFHICVGPDSVLNREYINGLLSQNPPDCGKNWVIRVFWGDQPLDNAFWEKLTLQGLFAEPVAIILRNAQNLPADILKSLSLALSRGSESTWPFICFEVPFEKGRFKIPAHTANLPCVIFAQKKGWYKELPPLDQRTLTGFIKKESARLGLTMKDADAVTLAASLPPDAGAVKLELAKVALACPQGEITPEALAILDYTPSIDIFAFLQGVQTGKNPGQVWQQFLKDSGNSADTGLFAFIALLLREARILWQLLAGESVSLPPGIIGSKHNLAKSLGFGGIARIWNLALQADKGVKTGEHSPQQGFELLIAALFRLYRS